VCPQPAHPIGKAARVDASHPRAPWRGSVRQESPPGYPEAGGIDSPDLGMGFVRPRRSRNDPQRPIAWGEVLQAIDLDRPDDPRRGRIDGGQRARFHWMLRQSIEVLTSRYPHTPVTERDPLNGPRKRVDPGANR